MSALPRTVRQTLTIARRDFVATVFTPTFLVFLLSPLFMLSFGLIGGLGASSVSAGSGARQRIVAILAPPTATTMAATDESQRAQFDGDDRPSPLAMARPASDPGRQARAMLADARQSTQAVLYGDLHRPTILYRQDGHGDARYLATLAEQTLRSEVAGGAPLSHPIEVAITVRRPSASGQNQSAFLAVMGIFFLTLLLAGQAVGTMAEERNNKVIEILAAAVPLEAVFFGKLIGMFGSAILFVAFWGMLLTNIGTVLPGDIADVIAGIGPATGVPIFAILFFVYFTMSYLLLGGLFLGLGAQATTPRELQMLSLPITIVQVLTFSFAVKSIADPNGWIAWVAMVFPFSSPYAMAGRAAALPTLWPHALAILWQLAWVAIVVTFGARAFRRGVLKSGSGRFDLRGLFARR